MEVSQVSGTCQRACWLADGLRQLSGRYLLAPFLSHRHSMAQGYDRGSRLLTTEETPSSGVISRSESEPRQEVFSTDRDGWACYRALALADMPSEPRCRFGFERSPFTGEPTRTPVRPVGRPYPSQIPLKLT